jgi:xanthine dehydrogenase YagR molybdenum-binding subunit
LEKQRPKAYAPTERKGIELVPAPRGNVKHALATATARIEAEYRVPVEHHNPMEPFATTVAWGEDDTLTVYEKTQGAQNNHMYVRKFLDCPPRKSS